MVADQQAKAEIVNFGEVQLLQSPPGWVWQPEKSKQLTSRAVQLFHPPGVDSVSINVFYRGMPVNESSANYLSSVLKAKPATKGAEALTDDEIRELSQVFGRTTVGDNQHTNEAAVGSNDCPVFNMSGASSVKLGGRTVIKVNGTFQDENGVTLNEYYGYFIQGEKDLHRIEEVFFQAPNRDRYLEFFPAFEECLHSLQWRKS